MSRFSSLLLASALVAVAGPGPLEADCKTQYRIWQDDVVTWTSYGDVIELSVGDEVDLYVHAYPSRSDNPYSAAAEIGPPADLGVGDHRSQDVRRVLRLGAADPNKGKVSITAVAAGQTALGYRITGVKSPGRLEEVPPECRTGKVRFVVRVGQRALPESPPPVQPAGDAASQLIEELFTGILRRSPAEAGDVPKGFVDQVRRNGFQGLITVAETMTSSPEFRDWSLARTGKSMEASGVDVRGLSREVLEGQLLSDIYASLYGAGAQPYADARRRMAGYLSTCITGRGANDACSRLARDLLTQPQYQTRHRELLLNLR